MALALLKEQTNSDKDLYALLDFYQNKLAQHPIEKLVKNKQLPASIALEFAQLQYIDSVLWVPMLAIMKDRVQNPRLLKALKENILCEAGYNHTSHVTLCLDFLQSLGVPQYFGNIEHFSKLATHPTEMMNAVSALNESQIAGWLLAAEDLVPTLFQLFQPAFHQFSQVDMTYFDEHIRVDSEEHVIWLREAIHDLLQNGAEIDDIRNGIDLGGRTALSVPDVLYAKALRVSSVSSRGDR